MRPVFSGILLLVLLSVFFFANIAFGDPQIPLSEALGILTGGDPTEPMHALIVSHRLNRTLLAIFAGGGLATAGLILQVYFRNPLAGPGVLGVTSGASLGVALVVLGGLSLGTIQGDVMIVLAGILGSMGIIALLLLASKYIRNNISLLVLGLMFSYFTSAFVNTLFLGASEMSTRKYVMWGLGSFEGVPMSQLVFIIPVIIILTVILLGFSKSLNGMVLGESYAKSMGVSTKGLKIAVIVVAGVLAGLITAYCGPIGFVGVAVPQLIRLGVKSTQHIHLIPLAFIGGAVLCVFADFLVRYSGNQLPVNAVTALAGAPIVIYIIFKMNKRSV